MKKEVVPEKDFASTVADELVTAIGEVLEEHEQCSICLSGGTTPAGVYRLLALPPRVHEISWKQIQLFWGDERFVSADDSKNNARMVHDTLLSNLRDENSPEVYPIDTSVTSAALAAEQYEGCLHELGFFQEPENRNFDIVLLGVGDDGHIASLFPGMEVPEETLVCSGWSPEGKTERISLTPRALFGGKRIYFLVKGETKEDVVTKAFSGEIQDPKKFPVAYAQGASGEVLWFLDRRAAGVI